MIIGIPLLVTSMFLTVAVRLWRQGRRLIAILVAGFTGIVGLGNLLITSVAVSGGFGSDIAGRCPHYHQPALLFSPESSYPTRER